MGHLERAAIDFSRSREPARFSFPESEKRVAVVGADLILEEVFQVISASEASGRLLVDAGSVHRIAHRKIGYLTYWGEYALRGENEYELFNAYTHRMTIVHEEVSP